MIEFWHNPRCSKSRQGLALLEEKGAALRVRRYLDEPPSRAELTAAWEALGRPPVAEMMRTKDAAFKEAGLDGKDDAALLDAMAANPALIERPLAIRDGRAVIGRPPERLLDLL
ncbi:arsenate reductase (glutaredoxin) [Seohaeicola zhoushanensis]|uniref:Arsenate reductase n=1 Tax=Seohaeicola zhoushanensis TaxID=1569283 RepID=A0A8J3H2B3_9RHOB|nr:arsenate reductase (glutaredoxin) [Seohaeicola zhoushanensis]GHF66750.1 arsenate reductase [Seohaeicola zhoushanensis]